MQMSMLLHRRRGRFCGRNHPPVLRSVQSVMATLQRQGVAVSWADLVQLAGAVAVQEAGGPFINVVLGRTCGISIEAAISVSHDNALQWKRGLVFGECCGHRFHCAAGRSLCRPMQHIRCKCRHPPDTFLWHRALMAASRGAACAQPARCLPDDNLAVTVYARDTNVPDVALAAVLPVPTADSAKLQQLFGAKGFSARELVALSGAHAIGSSQFTAPVVRTPTRMLF